MIYDALFRNYLLPFYETVVKKRPTFQWYNEYMGHQSLTPAELSQLQIDRLRKLLIFCQAEVPYYKKQWREIGFDPATVTSVSDLGVLPVLTKKDIKDNYDDLIAQSYRGKTIAKTTGGSTGVPLSFNITRENYDRRQGVMWRGYGWSGWLLGDRTLFLWGGAIGDLSTKDSIKERLFHRFHNRKILNSFFLSSKNADSYLEQIKQYQPKQMVGFVSPLCELAQYALDNRIEVYSPDGIITGAEPLFEAQRELIEKAFQCPVYNTYGCREFTLIAAECKEQKGLHMNDDHLVTEVVDDSGTAQSSGQLGNLVITDLFNYGMPMIRYANGDVAQLDSMPCPCGLPFPLLSKVDGRRLDRIVTSDGHVLPGEFFPHMMKDIPGVEKYQVVQKQIEAVEINIVHNAQYSTASEGVIVESLKKHIGESLSPNFNYVNDIALTSSGKHRVTVSLLGDVS